MDNEHATNVRPFALDATLVQEVPDISSCGTHNEYTTGSGWVVVVVVVGGVGANDTPLPKYTYGCALSQPLESIGAYEYFTEFPRSSPTVTHNGSLFVSCPYAIPNP